MRSGISITIGIYCSNYCYISGKQTRWFLLYPTRYTTSPHVDKDLLLHVAFGLGLQPFLSSFNVDIMTNFKSLVIMPDNRCRMMVDWSQFMLSANHHHKGTRINYILQNQLLPERKQIKNVFSKKREPVSYSTVPKHVL